MLASNSKKHHRNPLKGSYSPPEGGEACAAAKASRSFVVGDPGGPCGLRGVAVSEGKEVLKAITPAMLMHPATPAWAQPVLLLCSLRELWLWIEERERETVSIFSRPQMKTGHR